MIVFVTTGRHRYTTPKLASLPGAPVMRRFKWESLLFRRRFFPRATYVFTDFDRLRTADVELAGRFYDELTNRGMRVLNDPRLFLPRDALLRRMFRAGLNSFTCWRPADGEVPTRFPVFLRTIAAHRGVLSDLLNSRAEVDEAVCAAVAAGHPLLDLVLIEYAASANASGLFEKYSAYLIGGALIAGPVVNDTRWAVKNGQLGAATQEDYARQLQRARDMPHAAHLRRAFAVAGASYGRIDYGILDGRPEIYELNTNPNFAFPDDHPNADRLRATALESELLAKALHAIDTPPYAKPSTWCVACDMDVSGDFGIGIDIDRVQRRLP